MSNNSSFFPTSSTASCSDTTYINIYNNITNLATQPVHKIQGLNHRLNDINIKYSKLILAGQNNTNNPYYKNKIVYKNNKLSHLECILSRLPFDRFTYQDQQDLTKMIKEEFNKFSSSNTNEIISDDGQERFHKLVKFVTFINRYKTQFSNKTNNEILELFYEISLLGLWMQQLGRENKCKQADITMEKYDNNNKTKFYSLFSGVNPLLAVRRKFVNKSSVSFLDANQHPSICATKSTPSLNQDISTSENILEKSFLGISTFLAVEKKNVFIDEDPIQDFEFAESCIFNSSESLVVITTTTTTSVSHYSNISFDSYCPPYQTFLKQHSLLPTYRKLSVICNLSWILPILVLNSCIRSDSRKYSGDADGVLVPLLNVVIPDAREGIGTLAPIIFFATIFSSFLGNIWQGNDSFVASIY